jgi:hypothetical protein
MPGHPFIWSEGERGGQALERNGWWRWCAIMVMKAAVSEGDRPGWWWGVTRGGGVLRPLWGRKRRMEAACAHVRRWQRWSAQGGRRPGGAHMSAGSGEGQRRREVRRLPLPTKEAASGQGTTDSWPAGLRGQAERPRPSGERESEPVGKKGSGPRLGRKPELGPIQGIKPFRILFEIQIFGKIWKFVQGDLEWILT